MWDESRGVGFIFSSFLLFVLLKGLTSLFRDQKVEAGGAFTSEMITH